MRNGARTAELHREDGPAIIGRDPETGVVDYLSWQQHGQSHREDGPAHIMINAANGIVHFEDWSKNGKTHRDDGPAHIERDLKPEPSRSNTGTGTTSGFPRLKK